MHFAKRLRQERLRRHLSQEALAEALNISPRSLSRWEQGLSFPQLTARLQICRFFNMSLEDLFEESNAEVPIFSPLQVIPFLRNPFFTGRDEILSTMHTLLTTEQPQALALSGLGGVGKTQIALEYAYRHTDAYRAIFWLSAETAENIITSLMQIAEVLQLPERKDKDHQRAIAAVQHWLAMHSQWLLIWDNMEDLTLLDRFLPSTRSGATLITTRSQTLGIFAQNMHLQPMGQEEGILFLLHRAKILESHATRENLDQFAAQTPSEYAAAADLVMALGGLPLALDQAGAYIEETGCGLAAYRQRYAQHSVRLLNRRGGPGSEHSQSVATTLLFVSEQVEREQPVAADLLRVCTLLDVNAIPEELLIEGATHLGLELARLIADPIQFDQAIALLRNCSLVQRHVQTYTLSLHRLVQILVRERMDSTERHLWSRRVVNMVNMVFPIEEWTTWTQCERYLMQALACVPLIAEVGTDLPAAGELLYKAGGYLLARGHLTQAEPLLAQAVTLGKQHYGSGHPLLIPRLLKQAELFWLQEKYEPTEAVLAQVVALKELHFGPDHAQVADQLNDLALIYWNEGKYEQAEPLYQRAISIGEQLPETERLYLAYPLHHLALLYCDQGKYEQAEPLDQRALSLGEQLLGTEHPWLAFPLTSLGDLCQIQNRNEQAELYFQRALSLLEQTHNPEHPWLVYPLNSLADLYRLQGKDEQAEPLYQRALHIGEMARGHDYYWIAKPLTGLAELYQAQGKMEQAERFYQRALSLRKQEPEVEHPDMAFALNGLATLYTNQKKYEQAEPLYERALSIRTRFLGQRHMLVAQTLHDQAIFEHKRGNLSAALALAGRADTIRAQALGATHPQTIASSTLYHQLTQC